ncbi:hypothetical protein BgAZ_108260 [Babesia gibsoni]|uniref:Uncharacterized protein n=1 Tax=Babesia gibsoni TaxID=33632 RepID=A0AAD8PGR9_BABGI|nr:hypothetical protein BgAZ_108260 [Babesia gibsoni]
MDCAVALYAAALLHISLFFGMQHANGHDYPPFTLRTVGDGLVPIDIDIMDLYEANGTMIVTSRFGKGYKVILIGLSGYKICTVRNRNNVIYACKDNVDESVDAMELYTFGTDTLLILRVEGKAHRFGMQPNGDFIVISPREFTYRRRRVSIPYALSLCQTETTREVDVIKSSNSQMENYCYLAEDGYKITKLKDCNTEIWENIDGLEHIREVLANHTTSGAKLVSITVEGPNESKLEYYVGDQGGYHEVSYAEYFASLACGSSCIAELLRDKQGVPV